MKVCHVTSAHPQEDGRIFRRACVSSAKAGYETFLVQRGESYEKDNVNIIGIGYPSTTSRLYRMTVFARKAYAAAKKTDADLYHLHDPELLPYALLLKRSGKAVVFDSHENYVEQIKCKNYLPKFGAQLLSKCFDLYSKSVYQKIDGLTYPGNDSFESVYKGLCRRVVATDNLPWLSELYDQYDDSIKRDANSACYIGGLSEARGVTQIVRACKEANCKLYLAGEFASDHYRASLERLEEYSCVEYLGIITREEVVALLQKATIGLCTLLNVGQYYKMQNLPTKVYEYMSMSLPVIINDSACNIQINNAVHIGYCVDPMNISGFAQVIRKLLDNPSEQSMLGRNGRLAIKERYCWDKEQDKLLSLYSDILK